MVRWIFPVCCFIVNWSLAIVNPPQVRELRIFCRLYKLSTKLIDVFLESMEVNEHTEVLIKAIVRGDKKAFGQLFRMWYVRLCLYAESIVRDRDMAEDLVQNLFCMLWEKREEIDIRESMKAYLYRSVYHAALNSLKHEKVKLDFWEFIQKQGSKDEKALP